MHTKTTVGIVDDHPIFRKGLQFILADFFEDLQVTIQAGNGRELQDLIKTTAPPDVLLMDICMPVMNGWDTLEWLHKNYPELPVVVLTMCDINLTRVRLMRSGARAILNKSVEPYELRKAIMHVKENGYYYNYPVSRKLMIAMYDEDAKTRDLKLLLSQKEWNFLQLTATEMTYKQIADKLNISERAADKVRNKLFEKLGAQNRVVLAVEALRHGII
ncbi:MAG TPA: response regulator transcription factor [Flavisolibacter sp.]|nr:response regulator transcription factor [Flavisolibacter sp.]